VTKQNKLSGEQARVSSPRAFMRMRAPGNFSDSTTTASSSLDRAVLEYQLDSLTSRGQENEFETFARRLVEMEVCPNLLPHTGPTGGGDSKVDSETYPVAEQLAFTWYSGQAAADERWAFAFSAKKEWRSKVKSDVVKIAATNRGYTKAFFVTNQFVPDKTRALLEDELRKKHRLDVRIFDRTWILERVYSGKHEELAVKTLAIEVDLKQTVQSGPNDLSREQRIQVLNDEIQAAGVEGTFGPGLVDKAIETATLARELERPRAEVDGLLDRAERFAARSGLRQQRAEVSYQRAWTAYWWLEDYEEFADRLARYETDVAGTESVFDVERLSNLVNCAITAVRAGWLDRSNDWIAARRAQLASEVARFEKATTSPSSALTARALRLMSIIVAEPDRLDNALEELIVVIDKASGLVGFSFSTLAEILAELGSEIAGSPAFDRLYDRVVVEVRRRQGDLAAAELMARRAVQLQESGRPVDAIAAAGRALPGSYTYESRRLLVHLLAITAEAYYDLGLLWASRGSLLLAANVVGNEWHATGVGMPQLVAIEERLRWLEIELGRLPQSLAHHSLYETVLSAVAASEPAARERYQDSDWSYELAVGNGILNLDPDALRSLEKAPDLLNSLGLQLASTALLFALGQSEVVPADMLAGIEDPDEYVAKWRDLEPGIRLDPDAVGTERALRLTSNVLGVELTVELERVSPAVELAEALLAALEALLATALPLGIAGAEPIAKIKTRQGDFAPWPFRFVEKDELGVPVWELVYKSFDPTALEPQQQVELRDATRKALAGILARAFRIAGRESIETLLGDERALDRALNFAGSIVVTTSVLGNDQGAGITALLKGDERPFPYIRTTPLASGNTGRTNEANANEAAPARPTEAAINQTPHNRMRVESVVHIPVWDKAKWKGILYASAQDAPAGAAPPIMRLLFRNEGPAKEIWQGWRSEFGSSDDSERLRISIVRHVDAEHPTWYRVVVGSNPGRGPSGLVFSVARILEVNPDTDTNLERFLADYAACGAYYVGVAVAPPDAVCPEDAAVSEVFLKKQLNVLEASDIGSNDFEIVALERNGQEPKPKRRGSSRPSTKRR